MGKKSAKPTAKPLTELTKYFIDGNYQILSVEQLAEKTGCDISTIKDYIDSIPKEKPRSRFEDSVGRHPRVKGVVQMTDAASMIGDDFRKRSGSVTQDMVNQAAASGNHELAAKLAAQMKGELATTAEDRLNANSHKWFRTN